MSETQQLLTVDEFLDVRFDLPETGQWSELEGGTVVHFQPPDLDHGNAILNLSKALAAYATEGGDGYPCFDLGLILSRDPDTVRFPAISYFISGRRFSETDHVVTASVPELVIELASTADRRQRMDERVSRWLHQGVATVWVIDPAEKSLQTLHADLPDHSEHVESGEVFVDQTRLDGFRLDIASLFAEPVWWS